MRVVSRRSPLAGMMERLESRSLFSATSAYSVTSLVYNGTAPEGAAPTPTVTDTTLVDTWGLAMGAQGVTVSTNVTGYIVRYRSSGASYGAHAIVPEENGHIGAPTGLIYNAGTAFDLPGTSTPATYITGTEGGNIIGWNPTTSVRDTTNLVDNSGNAQYEAVGIGVAKVGGHNHNYLYATNFRDKSVDVFNSSFDPTSVTGTFTDPNIPSNFSPFGLLVDGSNIFITYCQLETSGDEDHPGKGLGILDEFTTAGVFERRIISTGGPLDDPYGLAVAPANFGSFSNELLIGDFGDGLITGVNLTTDAVTAQMKGSSGKVFSVDGDFGLWGLAFGNGAGGTNPDALYFAAPTDNEAGGLVGYITVSGTVKAAAVARPFASGTTTISAASINKNDELSVLEDIVNS
jgi:uncharacterized protein (TIGR03118 family)